MARQRELNVGDLITFKGVVGHVGNSDGSVRKPSLRKYVGEMGEIVRISSTAFLYPYTVKFKNKRSDGSKINRYCHTEFVTYRLMETEVEALFRV